MLYEVLEIFIDLPGDAPPVNERELIEGAQAHCEEYDDERRALLPINTKEKAISYFENYGFKVNEFPETMAELNPETLKALREDVTLNSIFYSDYENRYKLNTHSVCAFFDGFVEYLGELMQNDSHDGNEDFFILLPKYDTPENLYNYYSGIDWQ